MTERTGRYPARLIVALIGIAYLALGLAGFWTPATGTVGHDPSRTVWIFGSSAVLNVVHTAVGVLALPAALHRASTIAFAWVLFFGFTGLTVNGVLVAATGSAADPVNVNWADNWLHGLTALAGLAIVLYDIAASRRGVSRRTGAHAASRR
ncbi:DUF4383 domain-containing protein [Amycolatopsis sp. NPDC059027]|uniref:DUF4383 domain-containing protein n=1 Tax=unclassified Amycolatopsis TaxID=2618356 RepID=UPI00366A5E83